MVKLQHMYFYLSVYKYDHALHNDTEGMAPYSVPDSGSAITSWIANLYAIATYCTICM